jgi:hypothetical protein
MWSGSLSSCLSPREGPSAPSRWEAGGSHSWYVHASEEKIRFPCQEEKPGHPTHSLVTIRNKLEDNSVRSLNFLTTAIKAITVKHCKERLQSSRSYKQTMMIMMMIVFNKPKDTALV